MILEVTLGLMTTILVLVTLLPLYPSNHWFFRVGEFPRFQIACLALCCGLTGFFLESSVGKIFLVTLNVAVFIYQMIWILPYTVFYPKQVKDASLATGLESIKVLTSNVLMPNRSADKLKAIIVKHNPDMVVTLETDSWWQQALSDLHADYPYRVSSPLDNLYGMHLYSKFELEDVLLTNLIEEDIPSIHCYAKLGNGAKVKCHFLHPAPPSPTENESARPRDHELLLIAKQVKKTDEPTIVTGDLNDVAWSPTTRAFRQVSQLLDPRIGRGVYNTFHTRWFFLRWPLDHIFHSEHFTLKTLQRMPSIDSDHFPLLSELVFNGDRKKK